MNAISVLLLIIITINYSLLYINANDNVNRVRRGVEKRLRILYMTEDQKFQILEIAFGENCTRDVEQYWRACEDKSYDYWGSGNDTKSLCCRDKDTVECGLNEVEKICQVEDKNDYYKAEWKLQHDLKLTQTCTRYHKIADCHLPIWAIIALLFAALTILIIIIWCTYKCFY